MATFRQRPVEVEAIQFTGNTLEVVKFIAAGGGRYFTDTHPTDSTQDVIRIGTLEGEMRATLGYWIVKGVAGEFYPVKPDIFEATYDLVEAP